MSRNTGGALSSIWWIISHTTRYCTHITVSITIRILLIEWYFTSDACLILLTCFTREITFKTGSTWRSWISLRAFLTEIIGWTLLTIIYFTSYTCLISNIFYRIYLKATFTGSTRIILWTFFTIRYCTSYTKVSLDVRLKRTLACCTIILIWTTCTFFNVTHNTDVI